MNAVEIRALLLYYSGIRPYDENAWTNASYEDIIKRLKESSLID
jgi:hypothetical protein